MKQLLFTIYLLLLTTVLAFAQPPENGQQSRTTNGSEANMRTSFEYRLMQKEAELGNLISAYELAAPARQNLIRQEVKVILYELFDMGIQQKEAEVQALTAQLQSMQRSDDYEENSREIEQLKNSLQKVQGSLNFRKQNREKIVEQRLTQLLG